MESWVPLFDIFLNSPTPESDASQWLQQSFYAHSSSSSSSSSSLTATTTTASFLSLLTKPNNSVSLNCSFLPSPGTRSVMWIQTLPIIVQSRILSFLALEHQKFCVTDLCRLAKDLLSCDDGVDFWVKKAAQNLFDVVSESNYEWISTLNLDSVESNMDEKLESVPDWLMNASGSHDLLLPWLPLLPDELNNETRMKFDHGNDFDSPGGRGDEEEDIMLDVDMNNEIEIDSYASLDTEINSYASLDPEILKMVASFRDRILRFESTAKTASLAKEIFQICLEVGRGWDFAILGMIEPWKADDEMTSILISHLTGSGKENPPSSWPSQVLCSTILPKLLLLEEQPSRLLIAATVEYCKLHQKAAEYALLLPLILRANGINNPICDVITRIIRECLHPAHVTAFCQKLLCGEEDERNLLCHPCHRCLIGKELVWTEPLFNLFQNIMNHNIHLTQKAADHLVYRIVELADSLSESLKFGNFLLSFVTKCHAHLKPHKLLLIEAVECTSTLVTKSVLAKLANL